MKLAFREEHKNNLPTIRIQKITLENFKSVRYGEITFFCGKKHIPYDTRSDILGIYGQNGSGKTSLVEALSILRYAMRGSPIHASYSECISKWAESSRLSFVFDLQYTDSRIRTVEYSFSIKAEDNTNDLSEEYDEKKQRHRWKQHVVIFDETVSMSGFFQGRNRPMKPIIDTSSQTEVFTPKAKQKEFINTEDLEDLKYYKRLSSDKSFSFIFYIDTLKKFQDSGLYSEYFQVLLELSYFANLFLFVIDTKSFGYIRSSYSLPIYTRTGIFMLDTFEPEILSNDKFEKINYHINQINVVLSQLIPSLTIELHELSNAITKEGEEGKLVELIAKRDDIIIPFRDESDGVRKIISILNLLIDVFIDRSITVAIDEIDAGIYEYLLGELLQIIQDSGKGQLIFTSHNLRPLEILNKEFICFTTTNPDNRYFRMKGLGATNNLRNTYIREITMNEQDEELYKQSKHYMLQDSFIKAGILKREKEIEWENKKRKK